MKSESDLMVAPYLNSLRTPTPVRRCKCAAQQSAVVPLERDVNTGKGECVSAHGTSASIFCAKKSEVASGRCMRQMKCCNVPLGQDVNLFNLPGRCPGPLQMEAVEIMLEIAGKELLEYRASKPPILLRFSVQGQKIRLFAVAAPRADLYGVELHQTERIIQLFDGQDKTYVLPVTNKQFLAVRQDDGSHRFFAMDGRTDRR